MSFIIDNQRNFSLQVSPTDLPKLDAMRWDSQQLSLVVERTAIRPSDGATFLHGKVVVLTKDQQIESLNQEIDRLNFALGEQQKEIEDLKNIKVDPPKKAKKKVGDDWQILWEYNGFDRKATTVYSQAEDVVGLVKKRQKQ